MSEQQCGDPLHGVTLEQIVTGLVETYGWDELGARIDIRCFTSNPSIKSSLKFLRKTPWARKKVEALYLSARR
jgi:uncharacterized protein (DUF2132 family)